MSLENLKKGKESIAEKVAEDDNWATSEAIDKIASYYEKLEKNPKMAPYSQGWVCPSMIIDEECRNMPLIRQKIEQVLDAAHKLGYLDFEKRRGGIPHYKLK